jgi:hypothetical protein
LAQQNVQNLTGTYYYSKPWGDLREFEFLLMVDHAWTTDGRWLTLRRENKLITFFVLPSQLEMQFEIAHHYFQNDLREIAGTGVALERPDYARVEGYIGSNRALAFSAWTTVALMPPLVPGNNPSWKWIGSATWRPHPRYQFIMDGEWGRPVQAHFFVDRVGDAFRIGLVDVRYVSATLRQTFVFAPRLTLEGYGQIFTSYGRFQKFMISPDNPSRVRLSQLMPTAAPTQDPNFAYSSLRVNLLLRWEYSVGSTLTLVYTRVQDAESSAPVRATLLPTELADSDATDAVMLKWSHAINF